MRINCDNCAQALDLPADRVPDQRFSVGCPACGHKILVDPTAPATPTPATQASATPAATPPGPAEAAAPTPAPAATAPAPAAVQAPSGPAEELPPLRGIDRQLISTLAPSAVVVNVDATADPALEASLKTLGMVEIYPAESIEAACELVLENEIAILLIRMAKASAPPNEPLSPVYRLPFDARRQLFVALVADNVKTLDGQVAFYLQVNCLINSADLGSLAAKLRRALLHHLRLYRHWPEED